jgi:hypothetical protein
MGIEHWWPRLEQASRNWLLENNGDVVSPDVVEAITQAGGPDASDAWWIRQGDAEVPDLLLPDEAVDWIEAAGNDEELGSR